MHSRGACNVLYWGKTSPFRILYYTERATMHTSLKRIQKRVKDFLYSILLSVLKLSNIFVNMFITSWC